MFHLRSVCATILHLPVFSPDLNLFSTFFLFFLFFFPIVFPSFFFVSEELDEEARDRLTPLLWGETVHWAWILAYYGLLPPHVSLHSHDLVHRVCVLVIFFSLSRDALVRSQ
jgi:hypothetical protein